jgi:hypothetical protein
MNRIAIIAALFAMAPQSAHAFCGFYVGKAGAELYNHASQVVLAHDGTRTVLTMSNDFQGNVTQFALVVPVPSVLKKEQVHVGDAELIKRIDGYSAPRLVEYFDANPCQNRVVYKKKSVVNFNDVMLEGEAADPTEKKHVKVEAAYTVGEYDIVILSSDQSNALESWLTGNGYALPVGAAAALEPYIKQKMKFFVAKVNLAEKEKAGVKQLRPLQIAYESEKFMLPIRLGMANSHGEQDLLIYFLTRKGRVECTNYKTEPMPTGVNVPVFVKEKFAEVYPAIFATAHKASNYRVVHTEYVWRSVGCDPCVDEPLQLSELKGLGLWWLADAQEDSYEVPLVTRLHVRYDREHFPEDLMFQETGDQENFQARYVLNHKATGDLSCPAGQTYLKQLDGKHATEAANLAKLTGWSDADVRKRMGSDAPTGSSGGDDGWYKNLWP